MRKDPESQNLTFQWIEPTSSNLGRIMFFFLLSSLVFVALFYLVNAVETTAPLTVNVSHRVASLDLSPSPNNKSAAFQISKSTALQELLEKDLLFSGSSALGTLHPGTYELPFAQHLQAESPQPVQLQREVQQDVSTGLLVLNAPVLPPLSVESLPQRSTNTPSRQAYVHRIKYQLSPSLEKRLQGEIPETLGLDMLGAMPYLKVLIGVDAEGVVQVSLPVTSLEMPVDPATSQKLFRSLTFASGGEPGSLVWGHLWISREERSEP